VVGRQAELSALEDFVDSIEDGFAALALERGAGNRQ
jgi:hypothetical protein